MDSTADHEFNPKTAAPALRAAMDELAAATDQPVTDLHGIRMGDAFDLAFKTYGSELPEFWRVWNSWNTASDEPAPWGDL